MCSVRTAWKLAKESIDSLICCYSIRLWRSASLPVYRRQDFGYGEITVNSQGERQTKLVLVRSPFDAANTIRDIIGKPIVRVENSA
jgi:hypothetical protein